MKKRDDHSIKTMHFGTKPETKGYRLYDPEKKIIVSRVVFDKQSN